MHMRSKLEGKQGIWNQYKTIDGGGKKGKLNQNLWEASKDSSGLNPPADKAL